MTENTKLSPAEILAELQKTRKYRNRQDSRLNPRAEALDAALGRVITDFVAVSTDELQCRGLVLCPARVFPPYTSDGPAMERADGTRLFTSMATSTASTPQRQPGLTAQQNTGPTGNFTA